MGSRKLPFIAIDVVDPGACHCGSSYNAFSSLLAFSQSRPTVRTVTPKNGRDLVHMQADEVAQFDDLSETLVEPRQAPSAASMRENLVGGACRLDEALIQRHRLHMVAALRGARLACVVDEDLAHCSRRDGEEVIAVVPVDLSRAEQLEVCLVDERGRVQCHEAMPITQPRTRHGSQFFVHEAHEIVRRSAITIANVVEQVGNRAAWHA
jgi:hypothetical protein